MTPPARSKAKQQDVLKFEVDQEKRGTPAVQEKRRSSRLQKLSLSGASTHPDPISGGESKRRKMTIRESSLLPLCKSTDSKAGVRNSSVVESNNQSPPSSSANPTIAARRTDKYFLRNPAHITKALTESAANVVKKQPVSPHSFVKRSEIKRDTARRMAKDEVGKLSLENSLPTQKTSSSTAVIQLGAQPSNQVESNKTNIIVKTLSLPIKDGNSLIILPFPSPQLNFDKEAPSTSTPTREDGTTIDCITPLPKLVKSGGLGPVSSPSRPKPECLSPISPARNRFKDASFSSTDVTPFGAAASPVIPMETSDEVDSFHPTIVDSDLSFDVDSLLEGPMSEELEVLLDVDVDSFFAKVAQCNSDTASTSSGIVNLTTTDWSTLSHFSTTATVEATARVTQQLLSSSSFEGQQLVAPVSVPEDGSDGGH